MPCWEVWGVRDPTFAPAVPEEVQQCPSLVTPVHTSVSRDTGTALGRSLGETLTPPYVLKPPLLASECTFPYSCINLLAGGRGVPGNGKGGRGGECSGLSQVVLTKQGKVFKILVILHCGVWGRFDSFKVLSDLELFGHGPVCVRTSRALQSSSPLSHLSQGMAFPLLEGKIHLE